MACRFVASRLLRALARLIRTRVGGMLFFYEDGYLGVLMDATGAERVIRSGRLTLALGQLERRRLMVTDFSSSVLRVTSANSGHQALCYDVYGMPKEHDLGLGFNGEHYLPMQKSYALGHGERFYSPELRRFCSPDKSSPFTSAGVNGYAYCRGDPVNFSDPSGRTRVPSLQFLAGRKVGLLSGATKDLDAAMATRFDNETLTFRYLAKRLLPKSIAGLSDALNLYSLLADKTASYFPKGFDQYMRGIVSGNTGLAQSVSARAVENVVEAIAKGLSSKHILISQALPVSSQSRPVIDISYTGMTKAHEAKLQAALRPYRDSILQTTLPIRNMQPIPQVSASLEVRSLLKDMQAIRSIHG